MSQTQMSMQSTASRLSKDQIEGYEQGGYTLFNKPVFAPETFRQLQAIFEENLARYGAGDLDMMHVRDPRLLEFLMSDEILDLVEPLVGPDIGLWASHFISKEPRTGKATPWHEDSAYWEGRISTMAGICTVWLAIDRATPENGSMGVIPGTHTNGFSGYDTEDAENNFEGFERRIKPELIDESKTVYFSLGPNECSLHEARIIHGAKANTSENRRAGYTMRYFPTTSQVIAERNPDHKLWLVRGRDRAGNNFVNV